MTGLSQSALKIQRDRFQSQSPIIERRSALRLFSFLVRLPSLKVGGKDALN